MKMLDMILLGGISLLFSYMLQQSIETINFIALQSISFRLSNIFFIFMIISLMFVIRGIRKQLGKTSVIFDNLEFTPDPSIYFTPLFNIFIVAFLGILITSPLFFPKKSEFLAIFVSIFGLFIIISSFVNLLYLAIKLNK